MARARQPMREHMSISEFCRPFPTEEAWADFIAQERWRDKPQWRHCKAVKVYKVTGQMWWVPQVFQLGTGTVMEGSNLPLQTWLPAFYRMTTAKEAISSVQLAKESGVRQKTAWFLQYHLREAWHHGRASDWRSGRG